jgi:hypothetical protein
MSCGGSTRRGSTCRATAEFGKAMAQRVNYGSWWRYSWLRLGGLAAGGLTLYEMEPKRSSPGNVALTSFGDRRDRTHFAAAYLIDTAAESRVVTQSLTNRSSPIRSPSQD